MYRLIVADDEMIECMVLEHIIENHLKDQIELADSVQDGVSLLKAVEELKPDIAIVDINMPGLNGLDAIEILRMKNVNLKIIIHTAYSEFSYAQKALQLGAADYLLKPNMKEEIIASIQKVCTILDEENIREKEYQKNNTAAQSLYELSADKWMMSLFLEQPDSRSYSLFQKSCPDIIHGGMFTAWKLKDKETFSQEWQETIFSSLKEKISSVCSSICLIHKDVFYCLFIPGEKVKATDQKAWLSRIIDLLCRDWKRESVFFLVGVSGWKCPEHLVSGIHESTLALHHRDQPGLYFFRSRETLTESFLPETPLDAAQFLLEDRLEECLKYTEKIFSSFIPPSFLSQEEGIVINKILASVYLLRLEEELNKILNIQSGRNFEFWKRFQDITSQNDILRWVSQEITEIYGFLSKKNSVENPYISKASFYILENYTKDLPLEEVADSIGISPFYLSRLLKNEKHTTFVEMVTDVRIRKAMVLLAQNQKSIREIGCVIGYPNQSYFYKVFKKTTGLALGDVRRYLSYDETI